MALLVDTSGILAVINQGDRRHREVISYVTATSEGLMVPVTVLPEVDYLLTERLGPHVAIFALQTVAGPDFQIESIVPGDMPRILELMRQYADNAIGFVDASIVAVAERLGVRRILTLDRRHFGQIRPRHCDALDILP